MFDMVSFNCNHNDTLYFYSNIFQVLIKRVRLLYICPIWAILAITIINFYNIILVILVISTEPSVYYTYPLHSIYWIALAKGMHTYYPHQFCNTLITMYSNWLNLIFWWESSSYPWLRPSTLFTHNMKSTLAHGRDCDGKPYPFSLSDII